MERDKVKLTSPAKIGGKLHGARSTVEVTAAEALQLADMKAIEITSADLTRLRELVAGEAITMPLSTENLAPLVELMTGDKTEEFKTKKGEWSAELIGKALGRTVSQDEIDKAALLTGGLK